MSVTYIFKIYALYLHSHLFIIPIYYIKISVVNNFSFDPKSRFVIVLVVAVIKLIFFISANMGLWFGSVIKIVLITQRYFHGV